MLTNKNLLSLRRTVPKGNVFRLLQEVAENGADTAHLSAVHGPAVLSNFIHPLSWIARHSWTNIGWTPHSSLSESKNSSVDENSDGEDLNHRAYTSLRHTLIIFEKYKLWHLDVNVHQIGPGYVEMTMNTFFGRLCILQTVTPMEPLLQKVIIVNNEIFCSSHGIWSDYPCLHKNNKFIITFIYIEIYTGT